MSRRRAATVVASIIPPYWAEPLSAGVVPCISGRSSLTSVLREG
ncbi:hypothetical protein ABZ499_17375 [Streptomyces sp. NPDC019990]